MCATCCQLSSNVNLTPLSLIAGWPEQKTPV
jgi:hypothetical protein